MKRGQSMIFPHPIKAGTGVKWNGEAFELENGTTRVLAYDVSPSGWTDDLTHMHEDAGGDDHFIDIASRSHALAEVKRCLKRTPAVVLEIGVSSGYLLREINTCLPEHFVVGADYTRDTLESLGRRLRGVPLVQFDLTRCPLSDSYADVVIALNVLEHIPDDRAAMAEMFRILRPGGAAIIEVPAGSKLFDVYDKALMHFRRYDMPGLVALLEDSGFVIDRSSHLGFFLYPPFYLSKRFNQLRHRKISGASAQTVAANQITATRRTGTLGRFIMRLEDTLRTHVRYPVGIRCLVTALKPASADKA